MWTRAWLLLLLLLLNIARVHPWAYMMTSAHHGCGYELAVGEHMMGGNAYLSTSRIAWFEDSNGDPVDCGGSYDAGASYTVATSDAGSYQLVIEIAGGTFDVDGTCGGTRVTSDDTDFYLTAPTDGAPLLVWLGWGNYDYGRRGIQISDACTLYAAPTPMPTSVGCTDGRRNGGETDVDCGGGASCPRCDVGQACVDAADCASFHCGGSACVESTSAIHRTRVPARPLNQNK
jgi:hypothetical protein